MLAVTEVKKFHKTEGGLCLWGPTTFPAEKISTPAGETEIRDVNDFLNKKDWRRSVPVLLLRTTFSNGVGN
jgi:hypothetical protein